MSKRSIQINKLCLSAMFIAIGWLMPFITGQIPEIGNMLCPMHIPVLISGFVLGPWYGAMIGFLLPLTRFFIFGMPVLYPIGVGMMLELAVYGLVSGLLYRILHHQEKIPDIANIYISLVVAMLIGRIVWGCVRAICGLFPNTTFTWTLFLSGAFVTAWPGILLQIFLIPAIIAGLSRANLLRNFMEFQGKRKWNEFINRLKEQIENHDGIYVIAIDGMCASGKTTLGLKLAKELDANLVHMDDFYLPKTSRPSSFLEQPGAHMDFLRLKEEVLNHLSEEVLYQRLDCQSQELSIIEKLSPKKVWIVEGSYSLHPELGKYYTHAIFKKVEETKQSRRIHKRNSKNAADFFQIWIPLENAYFEKYQIEGLCNEVM